ncbi:MULTISPECIES: pyridoxal phosphate-dependent aminotransferase [unclassified Dietzia]|uniref:pyridoxal phosphate-dependent aminotransferase n=1 Tax=unclassified Dietzia TaxID=2617939 RepID=UPI0015F82D15|nr:MULTISPECIES: pyridoxal phosphate-dependent aminotransferase [unclassified Dietzia]MBB1024668.1 pyridoxal phosphate-dependent aminotransferase [Dietzia sp. DQ12-76]MBB1028964.1 pyridoxal phosphate-dependent aminotransferase [Dietzia sp. DQ11-38-2]
MSPDVRTDLDAIPSYVPGATVPGAIKLASNETTAGPLPSVAAAIVDAAAGVNRYPDITAGALVSRLSEYLGIPTENVTAGCGSVALCQQLVQAVCAPGDEVLFGWRSFEAYPIIARIAHAVPVAIPNRSDGTLDLDSLADAVTDRTRVIFACTPNNPTGPAVSRAALTAFLDRIPERVTVALDEAYYEYLRSEDPIDGVAESMARPNVVALRTFSKAYGLAGLRVGYLTGPAGLVASVGKMVVPFSVSSLAQAAGIACLEAGDELRARTDAVVAERERVREALLGLGHAVPDSQANFVWLPLGDAAAAFDAHCRDHLVITRCFAGDGVRVTIGDPAENDRLLAAARTFVIGT